MTEILRAWPLGREEDEDLALSPVVDDLVRQIEGPPILFLSGEEAYEDSWPAALVEPARPPVSADIQPLPPKNRQPVVYDAWSAPPEDSELDWDYSSR